MYVDAMQLTEYRIAVVMALRPLDLAHLLPPISISPSIPL
jgi:hypothetical protein